MTRSSSTQPTCALPGPEVYVSGPAHAGGICALPYLLQCNPPGQASSRGPCRVLMCRLIVKVGASYIQANNQYIIFVLCSLLKLLKSFTAFVLVENHILTDISVLHNAVGLKDSFEKVIKVLPLFSCSNNTIKLWNTRAYIDNINAFNNLQIYVSHHVYNVSQHLSFCSYFRIAQEIKE